MGTATNQPSKHPLVINGIIVVEKRSQAEERVGKAINRGAEFAAAAIEMTLINTKNGHQHQNESLIPQRRQTEWRRSSTSTNGKPTNGTAE